MRNTPPLPHTETIQHAGRPKRVRAKDEGRGKGGEMGKMILTLWWGFGAKK